ITVIVNTGDDLVLHGLHVSPDLDSVTYWLADVADRERGWGRRDETFRAWEEISRLGGVAWFRLGDLDLATHLVRTDILRGGGTLSEATRRITDAFGIEAQVLPMTDDAVTTRVEVATEGDPLDLHFQEYWVARGARDEVVAVRYEGATAARAVPAALEALARADAIVVCPSNPVASIQPILAVADLRAAVVARRDRAVAVTPIVGGAPLRGMADRLLPAVGHEVSATGVARMYRDICSAFVVDRRDEAESMRIREETGLRVAVTETVMTDDAAAADLARVAIEAVAG
ncbi:MAG TPA: 2-phospho-L-lactate transferase, partial [Actinomycetota bacterium]|nr:2-phospho-L-lactate transferase [Actinomycetota bacterium]